MVKRQRRKRKSIKNRQWSGKQRQPSVDLEPYFRQSDALVMQGRADQAVDLLTPLLAEHTHVADLHYYLGYAQAKAGDPWQAVLAYEKAQQLSDAPRYWVAIGALYMEIDLSAHAIRAYRQLKQASLSDPAANDAQMRLAMLEAELATFALQMDVKPAKAEQGLYQLEEGMLALHRGDYSGAVAANQRAARILKNWPPIQNNLSLSLFWAGQPDKAIETAQRALHIDPENIQALCNQIRFLAWSGREHAARELWPQVQAIQPQNHTDMWKVAEAAAILNEDQVVFDILQRWDDPQAGGLSVKMAQLLGVAEANLGQRKAAARRLKPLITEFFWLDNLTRALTAGKSGPGLADRYPYFHSTELVAPTELVAFSELIVQEEEMRQDRFQKKLARFMRAYPQIVLVGEKLIWEEDFPETGFDMLEYMGTEAAYDALYRFGTSQAGSDELRRTAIFRLQRAGRLPINESVRMWQDGQWQDVSMRMYEIVEEYDDIYAPAAAVRLNRGIVAMHAERFDEAEQLFVEAIDHDPTIKQAYNNLAAVYSHQGRHEEAEAMLLRAVELDPHYVMPRTNLAIFRLNEDDIEGARTMLAPLAEATRFTVQELVLYSSTLARVNIAERDYESARETLRIGLAYDPDNENLLALQAHLDQTAVFADIQSGLKEMSRRQAKRDLAKRHRMQASLTTGTPSVAQALSLFTKDILTEIGHETISGGGWSTMRKAELHELIVARLQERDNLERIVSKLGDDERTALGDVLANGGSLEWQTFDERYGNDLEDSPHWQYHAPDSIMGRLRVRGLITEATVDGELLVAIPIELRPMLSDIGSLRNPIEH